MLGAPILVLDELDSGVGGRLGQPVAAMLRRMSAPQSGAACQILCVSHLPQVRRGALLRSRLSRQGQSESFGAPGCWCVWSQSPTLLQSCVFLSCRALAK